MKRISLPMSIAALVLMASPGLSCHAAGEPERHFTAKDVFNVTQPIIFQDDFRSGAFGKWTFSEDDRYRLAKETPERLKIVDAPDLPGKKAVRFFVPRAANSFRAEISLPHEVGWQERWYGERILVPREWMCDPLRGNDIVMQWHAIPGNGKATNPNLEISVGNTNWFVRATFGDPHTTKKGWRMKLDDPVRPGTWVSWVVHVKWSPSDDGITQIWKDGKLVVDRKGQNVYSTIGVEYTPYLKTGIYHPEWHLVKPGSRESFDKEKPVATTKVIYATDIKIGDARAKYEDVAPQKRE